MWTNTVLPETGHVEHRNISASSLQTLHQFRSSHARKSHIGGHEIQSAIVSIQNPQRFDPMGCRQYGIARPFEDLPYRSLKTFLVFDEKYGRGILNGRNSILGLPNQLYRFVNSWQIDLKGCFSRVGQMFWIKLPSMLIL